MSSLKLGAALIALGLVSQACSTEGFCFADCDGGGSGGADSGSGSGGDGSGGVIDLPDTGIATDSGSGGGDGASSCSPSAEICNGRDDDCDGVTDEPGADADGIDFSSPLHCGNCATNCTDFNVNLRAVVTPLCNPPGAADLGTVAGTCDYDECATNFWDQDGVRGNGCEVYCQWNPERDLAKLDLGGQGGCNRDDDCDGAVDEDVDTCGDVDNCGQCGYICPSGPIVHTTGAQCTRKPGTPADGECTRDTMQCVVPAGACEPGWVDADGVGENGCEYSCTPTAATGGVEVCDGVDNDCDRKIDNADDSLTDPGVGQPCQGGTDGVCADVANAGVQKCIGGGLTCCDVDSNNVTGTNPAFPPTGLQNGECKGTVAPFVIKPNDQQEICDGAGADENCDGLIDNNPVKGLSGGQLVDIGGTCGSSQGGCSTGTWACVAGATLCTGGDGPLDELCDGEDNDCDGVIDGTRPATTTACTSDADCASQAPNVLCRPISPTARACVRPPKDVADETSGAPLACDVPPVDASSPLPPDQIYCRSGLAACRGGTPTCVGSITKAADTDICFKDTNCDGVLSNQTGLSNSDVNNCGACGFACSTLSANTNWECVNGQCRPGTPNRCNDGFIECTGRPGVTDTDPNNCETACVFGSTEELCNGVDDDCDCLVDENVVDPPSVAAACGVSSNATDPGCTLAGVTLACRNGQWDCTFNDPRYCGNVNCAGTDDICDGRDNNCDGSTDEPFKPPFKVTGFLGQGCFSDDGLAAPGHGACQAQGTFICDTSDPARQTTRCSAAKDNSKATAEICDGKDNDCDGTADDPPFAVQPSGPSIGTDCVGDPRGECAAAANVGKYTCVGGAVLCAGPNVLRPGERLETCNGKDDDCSGTSDDNLVDTGGVCGSGVGECRPGVQTCVAGALRCDNAPPPAPPVTVAVAELCDAKDNDCDGQIDELPIAGVGASCWNAQRNAPPTPPNGVPQPCRAGILSCVGGSPLCQGAILPTRATDSCGEDSNCDGVLTNQTNLNNTDVLNCGSCGNNCNNLNPNVVWSCVAGACQNTGVCKTGRIECGGAANDCETACTFASATESCNNRDDNCDCLVDNNVPPATPVQVCGVNPAATDPLCGAGNGTTGVQVTCSAGQWSCNFPSGVCADCAGASCSSACTGAVERCDSRDNDCDGQSDETFKAPTLASGYLGQPCATSPSHGPCQQTGSFVCNGGQNGTVCSVTAADMTKATAETCNGLDDDCDGTPDDGDPGGGGQCFADPDGECATVAHAGTRQCTGGVLVCSGPNLLQPGALPEVCNNKDDDCDGAVDESPTDIGPSFPCGSGVGACTPGSYSACVNGVRQCTGGQGPVAEICDGQDNDCDNLTDSADNGQGLGPISGLGGDCNVPPPAPAPTAQCPNPTSACVKGTLTCTNGLFDCAGDVVASPSTPDGCCADLNCDGVLTNQPNFQTDVNNCGGCGNKCGTTGDRGVWACQAGACVRTACAVGYINCDGNANDCERACPFSGTELCNGVDDDCDCAVDDNITSVPLPSQVCGTSASASDPLCGAGNGTTGVAVSCSAGSWSCNFPPGRCSDCTGAACLTACTSATDSCDGADNNCNGNADENFKTPILSSGYIGQPCQTPATDGACRGSGTFQCSSTTATSCNAARNDGAKATEVCDGVDNDCDALVDEAFNNKGDAFSGNGWVKPAVVKLGAANLWVYAYEASRPSATTTTPGNGNGYHCTGAGCTGGVASAVPAGITLDATRACSVSGKIPWFNVTPVEVEQTCQAMGGAICSTANWTTGCRSSSTTCNLGYYDTCSPLTISSSPTNYTTGPFCNLGGFDFDGAGAPNADGLLLTGSGSLNRCVANWGGTLASPVGLFDITGNLREITKRAANDYPLMGGAFNTDADTGAECGFDFYSVNTTFKYFDTGFRCCFTSDPTL